jgi:hypothetical protein
MIVATDWKPRERNTLRGFAALELRPSGLILHGCTLHQHPDGREWIALPSKPQFDISGLPKKDSATGKIAYTPVVEIRGKEQREKFQAAARAAVVKLLGDAG